ncbi:cytosol aminopeptidase [Calditerricola yamamurae]
MEIRVTRENPTKLTTDALVVTVCEGHEALRGFARMVDEALGHRIAELMALKEVRGKFGEVTILHNWGKIPARRTIVLGLGKEEKLTLEKIRDAFGIAARKARDVGVHHLTLTVLENHDKKWNPVDVVQSLVEGVLLGTYRYQGYKTGEKEEKLALERLTVVVDDSISDRAAAVAVERGEVFARATNFARDLVNTPANRMTPTVLAEKAAEIARRRNLEFRVLERDELEALGFGAFLSVAKGSDEPPKLIVLQYKGAADSKEMLGFIGKGITFDAGGVQIKPDEGMHEMKMDMAGAAAVLGAMDAIGALQPHVNVVAVIPACENLVSGRAFKPGDVITSFSGKTIEVRHTDAEGRLILADGIAYAKHLGATKLVDVATLTGAVIVALGKAASGLMTNDAEWAEEVKKAAEIAGEKVWELPLFDEYEEYIESDVADLKNDAGRPAGTIQGGLFLRAFAEDTPWVHLDIAGTADTDKDRGHYPAGATGVAVRTLTQLAIRFGGK